MKIKNLKWFHVAFAGAVCLLAANPSWGQAKGTVVEEIVARVNNEIITLSDYQRADQALQEDVAQSCQGCTPDKVQTEYKEQQKDLLRGLIDQALLVERAKDMDITVDTELIKALDEIRKQNNLPTMEDLQKAVESSGMGWEDYKTQQQKQAAHAGSSSPRGFRAHGHRPGASAAILRGSQNGIRSAGAGGAGRNLPEHGRKEPGGS